MVLTRLRIGHTRLTHSYLHEREDQPLCISCNEPFTRKHFLIDCIEFSHVRRQFFQRNDRFTIRFTSDKTKTSKNYNRDFHIINTSTLMASKLKIRLAMRMYWATTMKRSIFLMAHLFSRMNQKLLIWPWISL